jgi:HlyD family secretion protein
MNISLNPSLILERPKIWSRVYVYLIMGIAASGLTWASIAEIEQAVPATGKLEPQEIVQEVKAPTGGVVREIYVNDGDEVKKGQTLLSFDPTVAKAELESLTKLKEGLIKENQFYTTTVGSIDSKNSNTDLAALTQVRMKLIAENQAYRAILAGVNLPGDSNVNQQLVTASRAELQSRVAAAKSQVNELKTQLLQVRGQLAAAEKQLPVAQAQLATTNMQLATSQGQLPKASEREAMARQNLAIDRDILNRLIPLVPKGAVSIVQVQQQQQKVLSRQNEISSSQTEILTRRQEIAARLGEIANRQGEIVKTRAEVTRLVGEEQRISATIAKAQAQLKNTIDITAKEVLTKIADNDKKIAEVDTKLAQVKLDNQKKLAEIDAQISKATQDIKYQELRAPVDGKITNLQAHSAGFVANSTQPILSVVPQNKLIAVVYLKNEDIGNLSNLIKIGEKPEVDVKLESFPEREYGSLKGKLEWVDSDVSQPTETRQYYAFKANIKLENGNSKKIPKLQSGMGVNCSIKVRKRKVISIFLDLFDKKTQSLENVR